MHLSHFISLCTYLSNFRQFFVFIYHLFLFATDDDFSYTLKTIVCICIYSKKRKISLQMSVKRFQILFFVKIFHNFMKKYKNFIKFKFL